MKIGVAVGIPEPYAQQLMQARSRAGDPLADKVPPHVTLLPPTEVSSADLAKICDHLKAAAQRSAPFTVGLAGTRSFRPVSPVVYVALAQGWDEFAGLQAGVNSGVLETELQFPYHPHVTIAHAVNDTALDEAESSMRLFNAEFTISSFTLYENTPDGEWTELETFALGGAGE